MAKTSIEWTDMVWNCLRGCRQVSEGCRNCYAMRIAARFSGQGRPFEGLAKMTKDGPRWTGKVRLVEDALDAPLHWKKPKRIFVNSMSDLFHADVPDSWLDRIFSIMIQAEQHQFQCLTKRPNRMMKYMNERVKNAHGLIGPWPPKNVWLGVSVEDQSSADHRIPLLLQTPAAVRFVSYEPALGPVDLSNWLALEPIKDASPGLDWVIVGGESGPGARPFDIKWARLIISQCRVPEVPVFVKQLGAEPHDGTACRDFGAVCVPPHGREQGDRLLRLRSRKGGDMSEWPEDLRVREMPK